MMQGIESQSFPRVAYFCMEFALHEDLPIYAGGLGVLAGDYLKSAGDLGLPIVGLGILWRQGYTRQKIGQDGRPYDQFPEMSYSAIQDTGVRVKVNLKGSDVVCRVSCVKAYHNAPLYLLDLNLPENNEPWLTDRLYGGGGDERIAQEIILGVGGVRALRALGIAVDVYHFNEGHAVLAGLELIREKINQGQSFGQAWQATKQEVVFTTHTPVPAGNETHHLDALSYVGGSFGLQRDQIVAIGGEPFNMTVAGLRLSRVANAVSRLHAETTKTMWNEVAGAAPIIPVTNGVHPGTWQDPAIARAFVTGEDLWRPHQEAKQALLALVRGRTGLNLAADGLLIGFARRAAPYKRGDLIFRHPELIEPLFAAGRLQLILAGKAHPADGMGKDIIARMVQTAQKYPGAVIFLEDYDLALGSALTRGCDIWLNNPRRPLEACGTSGMKAAMNGVLNLSILDGWWPEGCQHNKTGWQIGQGHTDAPDQDERDAADLYSVLLQEVLPMFEQDRGRWRWMMRNSIEMAQEFSSHRMLADYYRLMYAETSNERASA